MTKRFKVIIEHENSLDYEIKDLKFGFVKNLLNKKNKILKEGIPHLFTPSRIKILERKKTLNLLKEKEENFTREKLFNNLNQDVFDFFLPFKKGKAFGSINGKEIIRKIDSKYPDSNISIDDLLNFISIKNIGDFTIDIRIKKDLISKTKIKIYPKN